MQSKILAIISLCLAFLIPSGSVAQSGAAYLPEIEADVVPGWRRSDGKHVSALRIRMQHGWKTYWRTPGDGGIPPRMDFSGSRNLKAVEPIWPAPRVFHENGMMSFGYQDELLLPILVAPRADGRTVRLKARLDIGVCKDICVPMSVKLEGELNANETTVVSEIAAAMVARPHSATEANVSSVSCHIRPSESGMAVRAEITMPPAGHTEDAVIETSNPELWVQEARVSRDGSRLTITSDVLHGEGKPFFLQRNGIRITVLGSDYAVDIRGCSAG